MPFVLLLSKIYEYTIVYYSVTHFDSSVGWNLLTL